MKTLYRKVYDAFTPAFSLSKSIDQSLEGVPEDQARRWVNENQHLYRKHLPVLVTTRNYEAIKAELIESLTEEDVANKTDKFMARAACFIRHMIVDIEYFKPFVISVDQAKPLFEIDADGNFEDLVKYLPFEDMWIEFDFPVVIDGMPIKVVSFSYGEHQEILNMHLLTSRSVETCLEGGKHLTKDQCYDNALRLSSECVSLQYTFNTKTAVVTPGRNDAAIQGLRFLLNFKEFVNSKNIEVVKCEEPISKKAKRTADSTPIPFYTCVIEGGRKLVFGDKKNRESSKHGYRYDVRGHFRKQRCGKDLKKIEVKWIEPHQRGLKHDVYIPKTYTT